MAIEKTFIMIKPDAVRDRKIGQIVDRIERSGLTIERMEMTTLDKETVSEHYAHLADKPFFGNLCNFMTSGPVVKMVVSGLSAVQKMRTIMGATNPLDATPGTIRGDFAIDVNANVIHGSDSLENAEIEIKRFFGEYSLGFLKFVGVWLGAPRVFLPAAPLFVSCVYQGCRCICLGISRQHST